MRTPIRQGSKASGFRADEATELWKRTLGWPEAQRSQDSESRYEPRYPPEPVEMVVGRYEFEDYPLAMRFLRENPFLVDLLIETHNKIQEHFGPDTEATLKVVKDPEVREDERLFVSIQAELPPREARPRLAELDREWWLNTPSEGRHKMTINLEYV